MIHGWYSLFASKSKAFKITETHVSHGNISCEIYTAKWFICPVIFVVIIMIFICHTSKHKKVTTQWKKYKERKVW